MPYLTLNSQSIQCVVIDDSRQMALQTVLYWVKVPALVVPTPGQQEVSALLVRPAFTLHLPYTMLLSTRSNHSIGPHTRFHRARQKGIDRGGTLATSLRTWKGRLKDQHARRMQEK